MSLEPLPDNRLTLKEALHKFGDPKLREAWMEVGREIQQLGPRSRTLSWITMYGEVKTDRKATRGYHLERVRGRTFERFCLSMWQRLIEGELVAFGRRDRPDAEAKRIDAAFEYLRPSISRNTISGDGNVTYYDVSICHRDDLRVPRSHGGQVAAAAVIRFLVQKNEEWDPETASRPTKNALMQEALRRFPGLTRTRFKALWKTGAPERLQLAGAPKKKSMKSKASSPRGI